MALSSIAKCESMERPQGNHLFGGCNDFSHTYKKKKPKNVKFCRDDCNLFTAESLLPASNICSLINYQSSHVELEMFIT